MITCTWYRSPFDASRTTRWVEPWSAEATIEALTPEALRALTDVRATRNGSRVARDAWGAPLADGDYVEWSLDVGELFSTVAVLSSSGTAGLTIGGSLLPIAGSHGFVSSLAFVGNLAFAGALSALVGGLLKQKPPKPGERDSPTYGFGGIVSNPAFAGAAYPLVYGMPRVAGPIVNVYTDAQTEKDEYLYVLIMVAGHKVVAIGDKTEDGGPFLSQDGDLPKGLEINGQPAENFKDIECHVRLGGSNQTPIDGFSIPVLQYDVSRELREPKLPPTGGAEVTPGVYSPTDDEIDAWDTEVSVTTQTEADAFNAVLHFPGGLVELDSSATKQNRTVRFQARIRRATNGIAIGDYAVFPAFEITAKRDSAFSINYARDFIDPASYAEPTPGHYLNLTASSTARATTSATTLVTQTAAETEMTYICWIKPAVTTAPLSDLTYYLMRYFGGNRGFGLGIEQAAASIGGGYPQVRFSLTLGNGSTTTEVEDSADDFLLDSLIAGPENLNGWTMIACTYQASAFEDGDSEVKFYCNGVQVGKKRLTSGFQALWPTSQQVVLGASSAAGANNFNGGMDECLIYSRALSPIEIAQKWNGGQSPPPASASESGIVAGWHLDTNGNSFVGPNLTLSGSAAITTGSGDSYGPVMDDSEGLPLRDRYLIEIQRITAEDDTAFGQERAEWRTLQLTTYEEFEYPGIALLALKMRASDQISGGLPLVTIPAKGAEVPSWDGVDPVNPFISYSWSRNPAWVLAHAATDVKLGLGQHWALGDIDWEELYDAAAYFDELVPANDDLGDQSQALYEAEAQQASTSVVTDPNFASGLIILRVEDGFWPSDWPSEFSASVAEEDAEWWFAVNGSDVTGIPQWLRDLDGVSMAVGYVTFDVVGGGPGGGPGGGEGVFEIWCYPPADPGVDDTETIGSDAIEVQRYERRMEFDGVFDRADFPGWEALLTIAKSARASPFNRGSQLSLFVDRPRDVDNMLTMGNIVAGSFSMTYAGVADRPNIIEAEFLDRSKSYQREPITLEHPDVSDPTVLSARRVAQESLEGISRRSQVYRHLKWKLNVYKVARRLFRCRAAVDQLGMLPGTRFAMAHDVPGVGTSGRLRRTSTDYGEVYLDRDVELVSGTTYQVQVRPMNGAAPETRTVSSATGSYAAGTALSVSSDFTFIPEQYAVYSFGPTNRVSMDFSCIDTELDSADLTRSVTAMQYNADVYEDAWATVPATIISTLTPPEA